MTRAMTERIEVTSDQDVVRVRQLVRTVAVAVKLSLVDQTNLALTDGYTTGGGLGLGLSGARRLVDEFDIKTAVGQGTSITVTKWCR
jgi:serine/threonine-protein kinase RsbT